MRRMLAARAKPGPARLASPQRRTSQTPARPARRSVTSPACHEPRRQDGRCIKATRRIKAKAAAKTIVAARAATVTT